MRIGDKTRCLLPASILPDTYPYTRTTTSSATVRSALWCRRNGLFWASRTGLASLRTAGLWATVFQTGTTKRRGIKKKNFEVKKKENTQTHTHVSCPSFAAQRLSTCRRPTTFAHAKGTKRIRRHLFCQYDFRYTLFPPISRQVRPCSGRLQWNVKFLRRNRFMGKQ